MHLFESVNSVFNADPTVEAGFFERAENGIVIVESLPDFPMTEAAGVAETVHLFLTEVFKGTFQEETVAGVHGNNAVFDPSEEFQWILTGQDGIAGVVVDAEMG